MAIELVPYDSARYFKDAEAQEELLRDAIEVGDAGYLAHALGIVARARGMTNVQRETGMSRQALYRALSSTGNPTMETVFKVMKALGLKMTIGHAATAPGAAGL